MNSSYDFVVVGAGTMGRSAALYLTIQYPQAKCALIEQFKFNHEEGSSHSRIRIIRSAYKHPFYRDLCLEAIDKNWPQVQKLLNSKFIESNPFLAYVEDQRQFQDYLAVANSSTNIQKLTLEQTRKLYPSAPRIDTDKPVFLDKKAGIIKAQNYMTCMIEYLKTCKNMDIYEETQLIGLENNSKGVTLKLKTQNETKNVFAKKVALTCGRWMGKLVPPLQKILSPVRQTISFWKMKNGDKYKIGSLPAWSHQLNGLPIYGLPDVEGDGFKFAVHDDDPSIEKKYPNFQQFQKQKIEQVRQFMNKYFKEDVGEILKIQKCYFTFTKSQDFILDWTDENQNILAVSPCSGHGFKFSPVLGKIIADLLQKDKSIDLFQNYRYLTRMFFHMGVNLE